MDGIGGRGNMVGLVRYAISSERLPRNNFKPLLRGPTTFTVPNGNGAELLRRRLIIQFTQEIIDSVVLCRFVREHQQSQKAISYRPHALSPRFPPGYSLARHTHPLREVCGGQAAMLAQKTDLNGCEHTRLRHKPLSQNAVQLLDSRYGNSLLATCIAPRYFDTVQLYMWQAADRVPTDCVFFRH